MTPAVSDMAVTHDPQMHGSNLAYSHTRTIRLREAGALETLDVMLTERC